MSVNKWRNQAMVYNPPTENEGYNFNLTVHAEIRAISQVSPEKLKGATVYIAKIGKDGTNRFSRPCANCMNALTEAGVKHVVYTVG